MSDIWGGRREEILYGGEEKREKREGKEVAPKRREKLGNCGRERDRCKHTYLFIYLNR